MCVVSIVFWQFGLGFQHVTCKAGSSWLASLKAGAEIIVHNMQGGTSAELLPGKVSAVWLLNWYNRDTTVIQRWYNGDTMLMGIDGHRWTMWTMCTKDVQSSKKYNLGGLGKLCLGFCHILCEECYGSRPGVLPPHSLDASYHRIVESSFGCFYFNSFWCTLFSFSASWGFCGRD